MLEREGHPLHLGGATGLARSEGVAEPLTIEHEPFTGEHLVGGRR
jgi:hypothetical protein